MDRGDTIVDDHTFEAIWKEPGSKGSGGSSDGTGGSGDNSSGNPGNPSAANGSQDPANPSAPGASGNGSGNSQRGNSLSTGDNGHILGGIAALVVSLLGIVGTIIIRRRRMCHSEHSEES